MASYTYRLPWPPSVNCYWGRRGVLTFLTKRAKLFRSEVIAIVEAADCPVLRGRLAVHIELTAPSKRKFDVDNHIKATLDALEHAAVFVNDSQIDELRVNRLHVEPPGACDVTITELQPCPT